MEPSPIFKVCAREKGFEGGGWWRRTWWRQESPGEVLRGTLSEASWEARMRHEQHDMDRVTGTGRGVGRGGGETSRWMEDPMGMAVGRGTVAR